MKSLPKYLLIGFGFIPLILSACGLTADSAPTANIQATIDSGVEATVQAQADMQAAIDVAVSATITASQSQSTELSEEEMAQEINETVEEAVMMTEDVVTTTEDITADGAITSEEYQELEELIVETAIHIDYAEYWIETYYWLYGDLAEETLILLQEIEQLLVYSEENLDDIVAILELGAEAAEQALNELNQLAKNIETSIAQIEGKAGNWQDQLLTLQQDRVNEALNIQAVQIPASRKESIQAALDYAESLRSALEDKVISASELQNIAQLGANAVTGLQSYGGNSLQGLADTINAMTMQAAMGQFSQALNGLSSLEAMIPNLPGP